MFHGIVFFLFGIVVLLVPFPVWGLIDLASKAVDFIDWKEHGEVNWALHSAAVPVCVQERWSESQRRWTRAVITPELLSANNNGAGQPRIDRRSEG